MSLLRSCDALQRLGFPCAVVDGAGEALGPAVERADPVGVSMTALTAAHFVPGALPWVSPRANSSVIRCLVLSRERRVRSLATSSVPEG